MLSPASGVLIGWSLGALLGGAAVAWLLKRDGYTPQEITLLVGMMVVAFVVGSKLLYLAEVWGPWVRTGPLPQTAVFSERMRLPGGFAMAILVGPPLAYALGVPYLRLADTMIPAAGLLILGIRIGCFIEGCCYGVTSGLPWAVTFPQGTEAHLWQVLHGMVPPDSPTTLPVHPLQLYFAAVGLLTFVGLMIYRRHRRYEGEILVLFFLSYLWSTWLLEFLRERPHALTQSLTLIAALAVTAVALLLEWRRRAMPTPAARIGGAISP